MELLKKNNGQKAQTGFLTIVIVLALAVGVFFVVKHYKDKNNNITIHIPKVEVH